MLVVIVVILLALVILLTTGTISFKFGKKNNVASDDNKATNDSTNNGENLQDWLGEYKETNPWDGKVTVKLTAISENKLEWIFSNDYCEKTFSSELINNTTLFHIQETCSDNRYEINYSIVLSLKDNNVLIKYIDGYMMSIASTGNESFSNVGPLADNEKNSNINKIIYKYKM